MLTLSIGGFRYSQLNRPFRLLPRFGLMGFTGDQDYGAIRPKSLRLQTQIHDHTDSKTKQQQQQQQQQKKKKTLYQTHFDTKFKSENTHIFTNDHTQIPTFEKPKFLNSPKPKSKQKPKPKQKQKYKLFSYIVDMTAQQIWSRKVIYLNEAFFDEGHFCYHLNNI